ncbi:MAG: response regulator [Lachnospiraceae bacterium]|nr:response regulator [Lachnospiraceae bacterium]
MKNWNQKTYLLTLIIIILGLISMILYNHFAFYFNMSVKMRNMGDGNLTQLIKALEGDLSQNIDTLNSTAITLEYMMEKNASKEEMEDYLIYETNSFLSNNATAFTGVYGFIDGYYLDGSGWTPESDYVPQTRGWYTLAKEADGKPVLASPYLDAKTNKPVMSISQMLSDNVSVISIDISFDKMQRIVNASSANTWGYIYITDENGQVISHSDKAYFTNEQINAITAKVLNNDTTYFAEEIDNHEWQVFSGKIMNKLNVIIVADKGLFFKDVNQTLFRNLLLCGTISVLILLIYIFTFKRVQQSISLERDTNQKIELANMNMIRALVRTIDAKDRYTNGHSLRVADYAMKIAENMGKSPDEQKAIYYAGLLHDVGKIRVPEDIINKPGKLTDEEFEQIKIHPVTGYHILKDIYDDKSLALAAKFHHERYDGKGYPSGLSGTNIPEAARIIGVADAYDAMASNRSYRNALPQAQVRKEIENGRGTQFDSQIADVMLQMIDADKNYTLKEKTDQTKTILIVDDDPFNIMTTELIMKDEPMCKIVSANSGKEALELLDKITVDLILLDVEMSDMNGFETLLHIRKKHNTPVAFLTGNKDIHTIQEATKLGVDDYINKPFIPLALKETIHSILNA